MKKDETLKPAWRRVEKMQKRGAGSFLVNKIRVYKNEGTMDSSLSFVCVGYKC